jgi:hypothetical protein
VLFVRNALVAALYLAAMRRLVMQGRRSIANRTIDTGAGTAYL